MSDSILLELDSVAKIGLAEHPRTAGKFVEQAGQLFTDNNAGKIRFGIAAFVKSRHVLRGNGI